MSGNDLPYLHGHVHHPFASDPSLSAPWRYVIDSATAWNSGTAYDPGDTAGDGIYQYLCLVANTDISPGVDAHWANYWIIDVPIFQNGWTNASSSGSIPNPVPMGYTMTVGRPNQLDRDTGAIVEYGDHRIEIAGDITGGSTGTTVFTIPPAYRLPYDRPIPGQDDTQAYVASRLFSSGDFVRGTP